MKTYVAGTGWRSGDDQPVGRHRRTTNETGAASRLHTELHSELRSEPGSHEVATDRRHVLKLVEPIGGFTGSRTLIDASLLDLLD